MAKKQLKRFLAALCGSARGRILAVNIHDGQTGPNAHVDREVVSKILSSAAAASGKKPQPDKAYEKILDAIKREAPGAFFRRAPVPKTNSAVLVTMQEVSRVCEDEHNSILKRDGLLEMGVAGDRLHVYDPEDTPRTMQEIATAITRKDILADGACFGRQYGIFWATVDGRRWREIDEACASVGGNPACRKRDYLGLGAFGAGTNLLEFHLLIDDSVRDNPCAAPTFLEALAHSRWMAKPSKKNGDFGVAADLEKVQVKDSDFDGGPEVILKSVPVKKTMRECRYGGRVASAPAPSDDDFLEALLRERPFGDIVSKLKELAIEG